MQIERATFLKAVNDVLPAVAKTPCYMDYITFAKGRACAFNTDLIITSALDVGFEAVVPAKELVGILGKLKSDVLDVSYDEEGKQILIKDKNKRCGLNTSEVNYFPFEDMEGHERDVEWIHPVPDGFMEALKRAVYCADNNEYDAMNAVHVFNGFVEGVDGHKAIRIDQDTADLPDIQIPKRMISIITKPDFMAFGVVGKWLMLSDESGLVYHVRLRSEDSFPDLGVVIERFGNDNGTKIDLPDEIAGALEKAKVFLSDPEKDMSHCAVRLTVKPNSMRLKGEGEIGWYEEVFRLNDYDGPAFAVSVVPEQLAQILPVTKSVVMYPGLGLKFKGDDFVYVFTCLRVPDSDEPETEVEEESEDGDSF